MSDTETTKTEPAVEPETIEKPEAVEHTPYQERRDEMALRKTELKVGLRYAGCGGEEALQSRLQGRSRASSERRPGQRDPEPGADYGDAARSGH